MSQQVTQIGPAPIPGDVYPVLRVSTEFYLRGFDLLGQLQEDVVVGLVLMTLVHNEMVAVRSRPIGVRELSRKVGMPYETVRRHVQVLVGGGWCAAEKKGLIVPAAVLRRRPVTAFLRKIYVNATRVLADLTRIGFIRFSPRREPRSSRLTKEQAAIALAATGLLLAGIRSLRLFWHGDLMKGLVYTAIWTANVKHVTNTAPAASRSLLADSQRQPVSVLAISRSLRLPYETIRRHADALVRDGICTRSGRQGLVVPTSTHVRMGSGALTGFRLVLDFLAELRRAGVEV